MGFPFNHVGNGCMTRRPIRMIITHDDACPTPECALVEDGRTENMALEALQAHIAGENARLATDGLFEAEDIIIDIKYRNCADIIITDTPGAAFAAHAGLAHRRTAGLHAIHVTGQRCTHAAMSEQALNCKCCCLVYDASW